MFSDQLGRPDLAMRPSPVPGHPNWFPEAIPGAAKARS